MSAAGVRNPLANGGRAADRGREGFVSLVSFVVENSGGVLNHEAHKGHEAEDGTEAGIQSRPSVKSVKSVVKTLAASRLNATALGA